MIFASSFFTPYYFLAVGFGIFAVIVSVIGIKRPNDFPGKFNGLVILIGILFAVATFAFVWRGGEKEVDHREHEEAQQAHETETSSITTLPAGVKSDS
jgi:hypothetical protein